MTYLIFRENRFFGHTNNKKILKMFLKERKITYRVERIEDGLLSENLTEDDDFYSKKLDYYEHYRRVLTEEELIFIVDYVNDTLYKMIKIFQRLGKELKFVRLDKEEQQLIFAFAGLIRLIHEDLEGESSAILTDYFDMDSIIDLTIENR